MYIENAKSLVSNKSSTNIIMVSKHSYGKDLGFEYPRILFLPICVCNLQSYVSIS